MSQRTTYRLLQLLGLLLFIFTITLIAGCAQLRTLDEQLWTPPTADPTSPAAMAAPPPILETIAGIAAALGYGGMAVWVQRNKRNGQATAEHVSALVNELEDRLSTLENAPRG